MHSFKTLRPETVGKQWRKSLNSLALHVTSVGDRCSNWMIYSTTVKLLYCTVVQQQVRIT